MMFTRLRPSCSRLGLTRVLKSSHNLRSFSQTPRLLSDLEDKNSQSLLKAEETQTHQQQEQEPGRIERIKLFWKGQWEEFVSWHTCFELVEDENMTEADKNARFHWENLFKLSTYTKTFRQACQETSDNWADSLQPLAKRFSLNPESTDTTSPETPAESVSTGRVASSSNSDTPFEGSFQPSSVLFDRIKVVTNSFSEFKNGFLAGKKEQESQDLETAFVPLIRSTIIENFSQDPPPSTSSQSPPNPPENPPQRPL